jgi:hypothetical protein
MRVDEALRGFISDLYAIDDDRVANGNSINLQKLKSNLYHSITVS